jgi:Zn-dependent protease with chaperone function
MIGPLTNPPLLVFLEVRGRRAELPSGREPISAGKPTPILLRHLPEDQVKDVATLFMTHPSIENRIRRLRALDGESAMRLVA